jgi:hypothetical protein
LRIDKATKTFEPAGSELSVDFESNNIVRRQIDEVVGQRACGPEIFKVVTLPPSPSDIHDVGHQAPGSSQLGGPAAIDVDGHRPEQVPDLVL